MDHFRALLAGGGAPEIEISLKLAELARLVTGVDAYCYRAFAQALEVIPLTLAENAGLNPITTVTELRNRHSQGEVTAGINVRKVIVQNYEYLYIIPKPIIQLYFVGSNHQYSRRKCCSTLVSIH